MNTYTRTGLLQMARRFVISYLIPVPLLIGEAALHFGGEDIMHWWVIFVLLPYLIAWCVTMVRARIHWHCGWTEIVLGGVIPAVVLGPVTIVVITIVKVTLALGLTA